MSFILDALLLLDRSDRSQSGRGVVLLYPLIHRTQSAGRISPEADLPRRCALRWRRFRRLWPRHLTRRQLRFRLTLSPAPGVVGERAKAATAISAAQRRFQQRRFQQHRLQQRRFQQHKFSNASYNASSQQCHRENQSANRSRLPDHVIRRRDEEAPCAPQPTHVTTPATPSVQLRSPWPRLHPVAR